MLIQKTMPVALDPRPAVDTGSPRTAPIRQALPRCALVMLTAVCALTLAACDRTPPPGAEADRAPPPAAEASPADSAAGTDADAPTVLGDAASDPLSAASDAQTDIEEAPVLSAEGYAGVRFGDTLDSLRDRIGPEVPATDGDADCTYAEFPAMPGVRFMVEKGIVTRADVDGEIPNSAGVTIGQPLAEVRKAWPSAQETPDKYEATGVTLKLPSADGRAAIVIEAVDGQVTGIRAGREPAVSYVESCG